MFGDPAKEMEVLHRTIRMERQSFKSFQMKSLPKDTLRKAVLATSRSLPTVGSTTSPSSPSRASKSLRIGDKVRISGMSGRQELNGLNAIVVHDEPDDEGRFYVKFRSRSNPREKKVMRVLRDRLVAEEPITATPYIPPELPARPAASTALFTLGFPSDVPPRPGEPGTKRLNREKIEHLYLERGLAAAEQQAIAASKPLPLARRAFTRKQNGGFYIPVAN